jgi:tetratricopeptide (TPR) repeat protein
LGQHQGAVDYYEKSLAIRRKIGDLHGEGMSLGSLGNVFDDLQQYQKSVDFYEKALAIFRKLSDLKAEGMTLNNLGNVHLTWGQYKTIVSRFLYG